ncbi:MAG: hypothetical protein H6710_23095 [Myxococcales bacterium]|nr:hypothetical protein [Myxococcales bacterium]
MGERGDEVEGEGRGLAALVVRLGRAAGGRWIAPLLALFALVLHAPTLGGGLFSDDIPQQAFLRKVVEGREAGPWWGLFSLVDLAPATIAGRRLSGLLPWWTADEVRVVFFRPLAVADHLIDAALWPRSPALMHLHSLLLFALLCALVLRLHRRLAGGRPRGALVALIAALSFTVDSTHGAPVAWIAQRNALLAAIFAVACLLAHDRWRRGDARAGPLAALVFWRARSSAPSSGCRRSPSLSPTASRSIPRGGGAGSGRRCPLARWRSSGSRSTARSASAPGPAAPTSIRSTARRSSSGSSPSAWPRW